MNLHERVLSVLACKFVDDVIFGAPLTVTKDLITSFNIKIVACGQQCVKAHNFYDVPKEMGIFKEIGSPSKLTTEVIVDRILQQRMAFESKFKKKAAAEERYNKEKGFVEEM